MPSNFEQLTSLFTVSDKLDPKSLEFLVKALAKGNQEGFDYIEFKQAYKALTQLPMDKALAMKSAFTTGMTMGLTKEKLLNSAEYYKQVVQKEKVLFDLALKNQTTQKVEGRKQEQIELQQQVDRNKELIASLQQEIEEFQKSIDGVDSEIQEAIRRIEDSRYRFENTFAEIIGEFSRDYDDINTNI